MKRWVEHVGVDKAKSAKRSRPKCCSMMIPRPGERYDEGSERRNQLAVCENINK